MVTEWGMSKKLGPIKYGEESGEVFLGHSASQHKSVSDATAEAVDSEVRRIVDEGYQCSTKLLKKHLKELHVLAKGLLEYETLTGQEITDVLAGKKLKRESEDDAPKAAVKKSSAPKRRSTIELESAPAKKSKATKAKKKPSKKYD